MQNFENKKSSFQQEQIIQQNVNTESFKLNQEKVNIDHDGIKVEYNKEVANQESKPLDVPAKKSLLDQYPALRFKTTVDISKTKESPLHISEQKEGKKFNNDDEIMHKSKILFNQQSKNHEKSQQMNGKNSLPRNESPQLRNLREVTPPNRPHLAAKRPSPEGIAPFRKSSPSPTRWRQDNTPKVPSNQSGNLSHQSCGIFNQLQDHTIQSRSVSNHSNQSCNNSFQSRSASNQSREFYNQSFRREESHSPPRRPALPFDDLSSPARPAPPVQETSAPRRPNPPAEELIPVLPAKSKKVEPYYAVPVSPPRPVTPPSQSSKVEHR